MKRLAVVSFILSFLLLSTSCETTHSRYRTPADQANAFLQLGIKKNEKLYQEQQNLQLSAPVKAALVPGFTGSQNSPATKSSVLANLYEKKFDINVSNIDAQLFLRNLAKNLPYSLVVDPKVSGNITIKLKDVSITQVLEALRDLYGFDYKQTSYGFEVLPATLQSRSYHVNYLDIMRNSSSYTQISADELINVLPSTTSGDISNNSNSGLGGSGSSGLGGSGGNGFGGGGSGGGSGSSTGTPSPSTTRSQVNTSAQINFWNELTTSLQTLIGTDKGRSVVVNPASGTVVVKAFPSELREVGEFLDQVQSNMSREVILEVKLLEVQLKDSYSGGIDWTVFGFNQTVNPSNFSDPTGGGSPLTSINIHANNFTSIINLLEQQGSVQGIANPRVLTVNNQQAVIRIGTDQFFVTGITTNVSNNGTNTGNVTTASVNLTPFFSGVILDITPQISSNGEILLHLHPVVSDVEQQTQTINIGNPTPMQLPLAKNTIREYDSIVRANDGQIVLIGGLTENVLKENLQGTPGLSGMPFVGSLFRATQQSSVKGELVILLKPTILGRGRTLMADALPVESERLNQLDRGFHAGSMPQLFGNEAEKPQYNQPID
ncbi:MAG: mshL [Gammaproteobacteria bacterium]|nr:mshL [Gammaproteobacteria bacterium]